MLQPGILTEKLLDLVRRIDAVGSDLAVYMVVDRPELVLERPDLRRTFFAERCESDELLTEFVEAFRAIDAYVEVFTDERQFVRALATGTLLPERRPIRIVYNGIGWGITPGGFQPGRKSLLPAVADSFGIHCANSDAYTSSFALHRFHSMVVLRAMGVAVPEVWHFQPDLGWMGGPPPAGKKVIAKSTYEAWSVGVTDASVFVVDDTCSHRVETIAHDIGQAVTVQTFVAGTEICVPILACPEAVVTPPVEQILTKAPGDPHAVMTIHDNLADSGYEYRPYDGAPAVIDRLESNSLLAFRVLQVKAFGRMDFRVDDRGKVWLTDAAISPGLHWHGSAFTSVALSRLSHHEFLRLIVACSLASAGGLPD